jgi:NTE family protein
MAEPFLIDGPELADGIGLCLSGGGYRAMLFHAGSLQRLNEAGWLARIDRISSVSGGSILAGILAVSWHKLTFQEGVATNYSDVIRPLVKRQAEDAIDTESGLSGLLPWRSAADTVARSYAANFAGNATLQDLPDRPRFVFNAASLMTGRNWRFAKPYAADWRVGRIVNPRFKLADIIAASSAFPPFLSPAVLDLSNEHVLPYDEEEGRSDLAFPPYTTRAVLSDGGVYDNLGIEPIWKRYRTVLVSNAGKPFAAQDAPATDWLGQMLRVVDITMDQDEALRERILVHAYKTGVRKGSMWRLGNALPAIPGGAIPLASPSEIADAARTRTRLNRFSQTEQDLLWRVGQAYADAAIRAQLS